MKLQTLNGSFGKVLAAVAIAFMISSAAPAQAQGQWGADGCYYSVQPGYAQMVRQGCTQTVNGQQRYYDIRSGRWSVMTNQGWVDLEAQRANVIARYNAAVQQYRNAQAAAAANQARDPNFAASYGAGTVGGVYNGTGTMMVGGKSPAFTDTYGRPYPDSAYTPGGVVDTQTRSQGRIDRNWNCDPNRYVCP